MANYFDQFDKTPKPQAQKGAGNHFDQFDNVPENNTGFFANQMKRGADLANAVNQTSMAPTGSQQTPGETAGQFLLHNALGGLSEYVASGANMAANSPMPQLAGASPNQLLQLLRVVSPRVNNAYESAGDILSAYKKNQDTFDQEHPRAARNFQATRELLNIPMTIPAQEGTQAIRAGIKELNTPRLTSANRKVFAGALYDEANQAGGVLSPEARDVFIKEIETHAKPKGERLTSARNIFEDMLETTARNKGQPLTLEGFKDLDEELSGLIHKERGIGGISNEGRKMMELQDTLRDLVENPDPRYVVGGEEGFKSLRDASREYKLTKQQEEIEGIISYANKTDNPATSLKAQMRVLSENPRRMAGYSPEARQLIEKAAIDNKVADFLRTTAGSRLISGFIGGLVGGGTGAALGGGFGAIPGAIGGIVTGAASRGAAKAMKTGQIRKIEKAINAQSAADSIPREIYNLPPAEAKKAIIDYRKGIRQ